MSDFMRHQLMVAGGVIGSVILMILVGHIYCFIQSRRHNTAFFLIPKRQK